MKKLAFMIIFALLGFACLAQQIYLGMYWITGDVLDPDGKGTEGRMVVFFKQPLVSNKIIGGYADDKVGTVGTSGQTNKFLLNACEDWRLQPLLRGTYYVAIVRGADGYGAAPVEVIVTGNGYDFASDKLVLKLNAGPDAPGPRPSPLLQYLPIFEEIRFNKRLYQAKMVEEGKEFITAAQPRISTRIVSESGLNVSSIAMILNAGTATAKAFDVAAAGAMKSSGVGAMGGPTVVQFEIDLAEKGDVLPEGEQNLTFTAANIYGTAEAVCKVMVAGGEPRLIGIPITYPSPAHLMSAKDVIFQYTLSHDIDVEIVVFDVSARIVKRFNCAARTEGGSAGVNKVPWNLMTDQGPIVSSGIYVFTLINKENGKLLGKGKFTALP